MSQEDKTVKYEVEEKPIKEPWLKTRYVQSLIIFANVIASGIVRWIMSVAILAMTEKSHADVYIYDWDKKTQGFILSALMWGEMAMQMLAGIIICKCGAKISMSVASIASGVLVIFLPAFSYYGGWLGASFSRFLQGMFQSFIYPCVHVLIGKWAPTSERTRIGSFIYSGCFLATVFCMPISSLILKSTLGWPWMLYIFGFTSVFLGIIWQIYGADSPAVHKSISQEEKILIESSLYEDGNKEVGKIPWKQILKSKPVYAIIICHVGCEWAYTVVHVEMATFFRKALGVGLEYVGILNSLADLAAVFNMLITSSLADCFRNRGYFTITTVRKLFNTLGSWVVCIFLIILISLPLNVNIAIPIALIVLSVALDSSCNSGFFMNHIDLSPNYSSILFGISSNVTKLVTMMAPIVTGYIVSDTSNINQWNIVFAISIVTYFLGNLAFVLFGSGEKQPWDSQTSKSDIQATEALMELNKIDTK